MRRRLARMALLGAMAVGVVGVPPVVSHAQTVVAQWNMDEGSGITVTDSSGNGFDGALKGAVTLGVPGQSGLSGDYAYDLNEGTTCDSSTGLTTGTGFGVVTAGTTGISSPTQPTFNPGTQPFSFSMWVNTAVRPGGGVCDFDLVRKGGSWKMEIYPFKGGPQPNCVWKGALAGSTVKVTLHKPLPSGAVNDGTWHYITCQRDATGEALIVDGATLATLSADVGSISNTSAVYLGTQQKAEDFYIGVMDDVSFVVG